jgi:hypothetical protein
MKSYREELWFQIPSRRGFLNITPQIEDSLRKSGIREGLCQHRNVWGGKRMFISGSDWFSGVNCTLVLP